MKRHHKLFCKPHETTQKWLKDNKGNLTEKEILLSDRAYLAELIAVITRSPFKVVHTAKDPKAGLKALAGLAIDRSEPFSYRRTESEQKSYVEEKIKAEDDKSAKGKVAEKYRAGMLRDYTKVAKRPVTLYKAKALGVVQQEFFDILAGKSQMDEDTVERLAVTLYPWLTSGEGADVAVRFAAEPGAVCNSAAGRADWTKEPMQGIPFMGLGHELIHAWRMVKGRRIPQRLTYVEEHMTTGLPPFTTCCEFTENRLRGEAKLALRDHYGIDMSAYWERAVGQMYKNPPAGIEKLRKFWAADAEIVGKRDSPTVQMRIGKMIRKMK